MRAVQPVTHQSLETEPGLRSSCLSLGPAPGLPPGLRLGTLCGQAAFFAGLFMGGGERQSPGVCPAPPAACPQGEACVASSVDWFSASGLLRGLAETRDAAGAGETVVSVTRPIKEVPTEGASVLGFYGCRGLIFVQ